MSRLAAVTANVWFDATRPAPAGLYRYFCGSDGSEVNRLCEGLVGGLGFIGIVKRFFSSAAMVLNSLEVIGEKLRHSTIVYGSRRQG